MRKPTLSGWELSVETSHYDHVQQRQVVLIGLVSAVEGQDIRVQSEILPTLGAARTSTEGTTPDFFDITLTALISNLLC